MRKLNLGFFTWPYEQEWLDFKEEFSAFKDSAANVVEVSSAFTSGTTTTETEGFGNCRVGTVLITTVGSTTTTYLVTGVDADKKITGAQISNA